MKIIKICILVLVIALYSDFCNAQIFVNLAAKGANNGSSWENAFTDLQNALAAAKESDQIWIASGTYYPGQTGASRSTTFLLTKGVEIYGGFQGSEINLSERNSTKHPTTLSGDLNRDDIIDNFNENRTDNVWSLMQVKNKTAHIPIIDGIIFIGGHADGNDELIEASSGGGLFLYGPASIKNCSFYQNYSEERGGALFLMDALATEKSGLEDNQIDLEIENCTFNNNFSKDGGAVNFQLKTVKVSSIVIRNSDFFENTSEDFGGGLNIASYIEDATIKIDSCKFYKNNSFEEAGGVIFEFYGKRNEVTVQNSMFDSNTAKLAAGAIFLYNNRISSSNTYNLDNCSFINNSTSDGPNRENGGGAIYLVSQGDQNSTNINNSIFSKNSTNGHGGAIAIRAKKRGVQKRIEINNCQIVDNFSNNGGGIYYKSSGIQDSLIIKQTKFIRNILTTTHDGYISQGGAMDIFYSSNSENSSALLDACIFQRNHSIGGDGGALAISPYGRGSFTTISNSSFTANKSDKNGGAILFNGADGSYKLSANTFENNRALKNGSLIYELHPLDKSLFYVFFHGVLWVQILYCLLLMLIGSERSTLYYALLMFGISLFFLVTYDVINFPFAQEIPKDLLDVLYQAGIFLSVFGLIKFAQGYLKINQLMPKAKKIVVYFFSFFLFFELIIFAYKFDVLKELGGVPRFIIYRILLLCVAVAGFTPIIWGIKVLRKGFQPAKYFLIAMTFYGAAIVLLVVTFIKNSANMPIILIQSLMLLTVITLGLADGYRVRLFKITKEKATRLTELNIAKTRLYTNITHEFRTPLTVIMGASDLVKGNESEKKLIKRNSQQLLQLINQMLDLSKLEGGALKIESQQGNIIPFIEYLVESFQSLADSKHIRLTFYKELEALQMDFDREKLQQLISNLISNAVKFTDESGKVVVHAKQESFNGKPHLILIVRDNGAGIPKEDLPYVFDRFFQVDASDMRRSEGSGIGLALVKELVQLMNGEIAVASKIKEGTVFTVRIPITRDAALQKKAHNENEVLVPMVAIEEEAVTPLPNFAEDQPLVLIIEDNKDIVSFLRASLQENYKIDVAYNGQQGIDKALDIVPDIIISDVMMPEADGYTVCKTLKADERTSHVPIILLTAKASQEDKIQGLEVGADAYLSKPFHQEELEVRLQKLIELRQQLQHRYQNGAAEKSASKDKEDIFIQKLRSVIHEKMEDEEFGINELCRAVGLSRMQVHRKLKAITGMPATRFLHMVRLQKAIQLLKEIDLNVSEVAYKVGFSDHSYFTKLFVQQFGKTPTEIIMNR